MFKEHFGSATVFVIFIYSVVALSGVLKAQEGAAVQEGVALQEGIALQEGVAVQEGVPVQAEAASGEGVAVTAAPEAVVPAQAGPEELTDEEIRQLLVTESLERFGRWKNRRGYRGARECGEYDGIQGPNKPKWVYCGPDEITPEQIELYRETRRQERSTFLNEPPVKF